MKKLIRTKIKNLINHVILSQNHNISGELQKQALLETVDYIQSHMKNIQSFNSKNDVMATAINKCKIKGLALEFGVFSGGTINLISEYLSEQEVYGFDSFEGLPEDWRDGFPKGQFKVGELPKVNTNVYLIKGWFDETLPEFLKKHQEKISFLHIDCDLYSSTKTIFEILGEQIVSGTVILFDEYFNYPGWREGEFKAFMEFIEKKKLNYRYITYNNQHEQVAIIIE